MSSIDGSISSSCSEPGQEVFCDRFGKVFAQSYDVDDLFRHGDMSEPVKSQPLACPEGPALCKTTGPQVDKVCRCLDLDASWDLPASSQSEGESQDKDVLTDKVGGDSRDAPRDLQGEFSSRGRSRSRSHGTARSSPSPGAARRPRVGPLATKVEKPLAPAGVEFWRQPLFNAVESVRAQLPLEPRRHMALESLCTGTGAEIFGAKV